MGGRVGLMRLCLTSGCVGSSPSSTTYYLCDYSIIFFNINLFILLFYFIYFLLAELGLCCCARAFSSCVERGLLFAAAHGLLIVVDSLVVEHGL